MADITIRAYGAARSTEVDLDDGSLRLHDWVESSFGEASHPEAKEELSETGTILTLPLDNAWQKRVVRLVGAIQCSSHFDKLAKISATNSLFQGLRTIRLHGREMDVILQAPKEIGEGKKTPFLYEYEVTGSALTPLPFWRDCDTLAGIQWSDLLYPDYGVPPGEIQPAWIFGPGGTALNLNPGTGAHFTINNWGSAPTNAAIALSGLAFPFPSVPFYIHGIGNQRAIVSEIEVGTETATIAESARLILYPGLNPIRMETAAGTAVDLTYRADTQFDFGATKLRNL